MSIELVSESRETTADDARDVRDPRDATREAVRDATRSELERELESMHAHSFGWAMSCCGWRRADLLTASAGCRRRSKRTSKPHTTWTPLCRCNTDVF